MASPIPVGNKSITMGVLGKKKRSRCDPAVKHVDLLTSTILLMHPRITTTYESVPSVVCYEDCLVITSDKLTKC